MKHDCIIMSSLHLDWFQKHLIPPISHKWSSHSNSCLDNGCQQFCLTSYFANGPWSSSRFSAGCYHSNSITCITLILTQPNQFFFSLSHCIVIAFSEVNLFLFKCAVLYETMRNQPVPNTAFFFWEGYLLNRVRVPSHDLGWVSFSSC